MAVRRAAPDGGDVSAPPPSPIPTAKGVRSAANEILSQYLDKSVHVPDLALPGVGTVKQGGLIPEEMDLAARDREAVAMRSARQTGAVRVRGHGIGREEMKAVVRDAERIFRVLEERDTGFRQNLGGDREEIIWVGGSHDQDHHRMAWARQYIGPQLYRPFREKMENLRSKLEATAEEMSRILIFTDDQKAAAAGNYVKQDHVTVSGPGAGSTGGSVLSIYRHNNSHHHRRMMRNDDDSAADDDEDDDDAHGHILNLHLPAKSCEFRLRSGHHGHSSFEAGPETVIVTVGKRLQERSMGEFKSVSGRIVYGEQDYRRPRHDDQSFSMELKWSSPDPIKLSRRSLMMSTKGSSSSASANNTTCCCKIISFQDQLLFALIILSFYSFLFF